ncbi:hypothetical protein FHW18_001490 [Pigmentiphaga litoralis]|uniref:Uncharacterized protein n=1 Tax=Pigmentiphaga litoralis TaxID=516702 RepID=A0A7Y9ITY4_9BURK|nr:hypothetical protein [Pigmentiphaga litoralis]NYE82219.1 hypothetical protein [Pigmentiphaga litoralis]
MKKSLFVVLLVAAMPVMAKLPAPTPELKAKSAETAAKQAWQAKVDGYQLCQSQDKVAAAYRTSAQAAGKPVGPVVATPPCSDPGEFKYVNTDLDQRPLEAAGAHSPATPAASPHNTRETDAGSKTSGGDTAPAAQSSQPATVKEPSTRNSAEPSKK